MVTPTEGAQPLTVVGVPGVDRFPPAVDGRDPGAVTVPAVPAYERDPRGRTTRPGL